MDSSLFSEPNKGAYSVSSQAKRCGGSAGFTVTMTANATNSPSHQFGVWALRLRRIECYTGSKFLVLSV